MNVSSKGMTLIELMVVIAIAAILLTIAAPSFKGIIIRSNIETLQSQFALSVITARTEAASRGVEVKLCAMPLPASAAAACTSTDWASNGWAAFYVDDNDDIQVVAEFENKAGYPLDVLEEGMVKAPAITFNEQGYNTGRKRFLFVVCDKAAATYARGVMVELSGRTALTTGDGNIHKARFHMPGVGAAMDSAPEVNLENHCS